MDPIIMNDKKNQLDPEVIIKQLDQTMIEMRLAVARLRHCAERSNAALLIQSQQDEALHTVKAHEVEVAQSKTHYARNDSVIVLH